MAARALGAKIESDDIPTREDITGKKSGKKSGEVGSEDAKWADEEARIALDELNQAREKMKHDGRTSYLETLRGKGAF